MIDTINGLHHVTMMASAAAPNDRFYRGTLGLRRVKKTVNFDQPDVYHLYFGDGAGSPGSVMTSFPFGNIRRSRIGTGETSLTSFAVPRGSLGFWEARLKAAGTPVAGAVTAFGAGRLMIEGPDGEMLALEEADDERTPFLHDGIDEGAAIRGFRSVMLRVRDAAPMAELLELMGYARTGEEDGVHRFTVRGGGRAGIVDVHEVPDGSPAAQGAGSIHHVAFSVPDDDAQGKVRTALVEAGYQVTPVIDRDYFNAIYFRTPGGVLFEVATDTPGFATDEDPAHLGTTLQLPTQHEPLRERIERVLEPLDD